MKVTLLRLSVAAVAGLVAGALRAQSPAPAPTPRLFDDDWMQPKLSFEEYSRQVDALGAVVGSSAPWRPPDPAFETATAWREAVLRAPRLTPAQVLAQADRPRLSLRWAEFMKELYGRNTEAYIDIIRALEHQGRRTDPSGAVALEVTLGGGTVTHRTTRGGREVGKVTYPTILIEARLKVPVRVLRAGRPQPALAVMARASVVRVAADPLTRAVVAAAIREAVAQVYARAAASSVAAPAPTDAWAAWLAGPAPLEERRAAFSASPAPRGTRPEVALGGITGFSLLSARFVNLHLARGAWFSLSDDDLQRNWTQRLNAAGFDVRTPGGPELRHEIELAPIREAGAAQDGVVWLSHASIRDDDCLAVLGGKFVRLAGETHVEDTRYGFETPERATGDLRRTVPRLIDELVRQLGPGGAREGQARHAHADAVAAYLRRRQIVAVPEGTLAEISNRIALAFANAPGIPDSYRRDFIVQHDGQSYFDLGRVGTMRQGTRTPRSVKDAINRVISDLTLADPLGLFAFDDVWNPPRGYRPPELPASFLRRLSGPRPSGAGALCAERVVPAIDLAYRRVSEADHPRQTELRLRLREFDAELRAIRLLACDYLPADGQMNYVNPRHFLYETEPKGWSALVARLPAELRFDRIGPALSAGPATLAEADQAIAKPKK
ncbi:MAG: hypothetical protein JNL92_16615 [Opitutaceae bacterium]|nr:hypothetical protein [Opitutaceae bacterium]